MAKNNVKLSSASTSVAVNGYAVLVFSFASKPVGFSLDDIKVTNGAVTGLTQDAANPLVYTALFTPGNTKAPMSTIQLVGEYSDEFGMGNPSNTLTLKTDLSVLIPTVGFATNNFSVTEGNGGNKSFSYTISLSQAVSSSVTVGYTTDKQQGTATAGSDFIAKTGSVTFAPGETSKTFTIDIVGDTLYEGKEYFYTHLTTVDGGVLVANGAEGMRSNWAMTYIDNDDVLQTPSVGFSSNNFSTVEGNSGVKNFDFTVTLDKASTEAVVVGYSTAKQQGTATAGSDFVSQIGTVTFAPGETSKTISVGIVGDTAYEGNEYFYLNLTSVTGGALVVNGANGLRSNWAMGYITNDDVNPTPTVGFSSNNATTTEGNLGTKTFEFVASLNKASNEVVTVNYTTDKMKGTATAGSDFVAETGSITFAPGETSKTVTIDVIGDTTYEGKEYFYLHMTSATGASLVTNGAEGTRSNWSMGYIANDDMLGNIGPSTVYGTSGKDVLGGTAHEDIIDGMGGQDLITGFAGADLFVLSATYATLSPDLAATIFDFKDNEDHIGLKGGLTFNDLHIEQGVGTHINDVMIYLDTGESLATLVGVKAEDFSASDFMSI